jgi:hypothetical protein
MINAVNARATLPSTRAEEPRASMRACSYHASPGPGQGNVLWIGLWMIYINTLVNLSTAVDEGCCGKVDNRCDAGPARSRAFRDPQCDTKYPQASLRGPGPVTQCRSDRLTLTLLAGDLRTGDFTDHHGSDGATPRDLR